MTGRYERQEELVPLSRLDGVLVEIIGTGAVGRQVALQLAAMGVPKIRLTDFDKVEEVNLAPQGFREADIGMFKVSAVAKAMKENNSTIEIVEENGRFKKSQVTPGAVVFCCVDDMDIRKFIFDNYRVSKLFVDGRMSAETLKVFTAYNRDSVAHYEKNLFPQAEAFTGRCTARSTIYSASLIAALMVSMLAKFLRDHDPEKEIEMNILTAEFNVR